MIVLAGTFDLSEHQHNGRPYWIGGSGLKLYVQATVVDARVGASWVIDTDFNAMSTIGYAPAAPGMLPPFGVQQWWWNIVAERGTCSVTSCSSFACNLSRAFTVKKRPLD